MINLRCGTQFFCKRSSCRPALFICARRFYLKLLTAVLVLALAGCADIPIAQDISQSQATSIVAALGESGISSRAYKETGARGRYRVEVKEGNYSRAVGILNRKGLPGKPRASFEDLIAQRGFIPDSRSVEALRLDHAMGVQIEEILENHPAVVSSRVIVRSKSIADDSEEEPVVSAVIKQRDDVRLRSAEVLKLIENSVPGVVGENIFLSIQKALPQKDFKEQGGVYAAGDGVVRVPLVPFLYSWHIPEDEYNSIAVVLVLLIVAIGLSGILLGYWVGTFRSQQQIFEADLPELKAGGMGPMKLDSGPRRSLPEV